MAQEIIKQPPVILIFGRRGVGKTFLSVELARSWPMAQVWTFNPRHDPKLSGFPSWDLKHPPPLRNVLLLVDEFNLVCRPNKWRAPWVEDACSGGRHSNVGIIGNVQRPQMIHTDLHSLFTAVYIGQTTRQGDIDYLVRAFGADAAGAAALAPREFIEIIA